MGSNSKVPQIQTVKISTMNHKIVMSIFSIWLLPLFMPAECQANLSPRKLTIPEVKRNHLITPNTKSYEGEQLFSSLTVPLSHIPKGTNLKTSPQDAIRMPGTAWCGKGWRVDSAKSMGGYSGANRCCRHHDLGCPISIEPGQTKYGLTNVRIHTVMHCSCDERFRSCLKMARTMAADIVGNLFFNTINIPCFTFSKGKTCSARNWWGRCTSQEEKPSAVWRNPLPYA